MRRFTAAAAALVAMLMTLASAGPSVAMSGLPSSASPSLSTPYDVAAAQIVSVTYPDGTRADWTRAALRDMAKTTVTAADGSTVTGVALPTLAANGGAVPTDNGKNPQLRTSYLVAGSQNQVRFSGGELDPSFGNHPALLVEDSDGQIDLVVCQDATTARTVKAVTWVKVEFTMPTVAAPTTPGGLVLSGGGQTLDVTAAQLARLRQQDAKVSYLSGTGPQSHYERGVTLADLFTAIGVKPTATTLLTAVGSDGYGASVSAGEALYGNRIMGLSFVEDGTPLAQPRLVVIGDVKGGRYVSDVTHLIIQLS